MSKYGRTDLASESHSFLDFPADAGHRGFAVRKETIRGLAVTAVDILNSQGSNLLSLPCGHYATLHLPEIVPPGDPVYSQQVHALSELIRRFLPNETFSSAMVAALGNPDVTPDALGPLTAQYVLVTRHLQDNASFRSFRSTALCRTGVLGTTGMESSFQIHTLSAALRPDCILVIDALAGADPESLCRCVQVTDAGIAPGSGVGNDRATLDRETLGVPVVAIGVPTVIDAASLSDRDDLSSLFVTPRYIDSEVRRFARVIGCAINMALQPGLTLEEMELLLF